MDTNKGLLSFIQRSSTIDGTDCGRGAILGEEIEMFNIDKQSDEFARMVQFFANPHRTSKKEYNIDLKELFSEQSRKYTADEAIWMFNSVASHEPDLFSRENYAQYSDELKNTLDKQEPCVVALIVRTMTSLGWVINFINEPWFLDIVMENSAYWDEYHAMSHEELDAILERNVF